MFLRAAILCGEEVHHHLIHTGYYLMVKENWQELVNIMNLPKHFYWLASVYFCTQTERAGMYRVQNGRSQTGHCFGYQQQQASEKGFADLLVLLHLGFLFLTVCQVLQLIFFLKECSVTFLPSIEFRIFWPTFFAL